MSKIILNASVVMKKPKHDADSLLDDLAELDSEPAMALSTFNPNKDKKKKKKDEVDELIEATEESTDDWLHTIATFKREPIKTSKHDRSGIFDYISPEDGSRKKKKKKKGTKDSMPDYSKEFEPEINLLRNILSDQTKFTNSLQQRYDLLDASKSAARGIGKFTTDLVSQINQARNTSMQITDRIISAKKAIADLQMKARKEMGPDADKTDMGQYGSNLLKQIMGYDRKELGMYSADSVPEEGDENDLFSNVSNDLAESGVDRSDEVDKYMQYGTNIEIYAVVDRETKEYEFEAVDTTTGQVVDDYPLPVVNKLTFNASTNIATDDYYTKYPIRWI